MKDVIAEEIGEELVPKSEREVAELCHIVTFILHNGVTYAYVHIEG